MWTAWRGISFFWRLLQARHPDTGIGTSCVPAPDLLRTPTGCGLQPAQDKAVWRSHLPANHLPQWKPAAFLSQDRNAESMLIVSKNKIPELFIYLDPTETHWKHSCWGFIFNFHSIYYQLFTHKHLSRCFQILCVIYSWQQSCASVINLIFQVRKLRF